jgi:hypothetical protein
MRNDELIARLETMHSVSFRVNVGEELRKLIDDLRASPVAEAGARVECYVTGCRDTVVVKLPSGNHFCAKHHATFEDVPEPAPVAGEDVTALWECVRMLAKTLYRKAEGEIGDVEVSWYMGKINASAVAALKAEWVTKCGNCGKGRGGVCGACHCDAAIRARADAMLRERARKEGV